MPAPRSPALLVSIALLLHVGLGEGTSLLPLTGCPGVCDPSRCPPTDPCLGETLLDHCDCCETCARTLGEKCGGPHGQMGDCDLGLSCNKDLRECEAEPFRRGIRDCNDYLKNAVGRCEQIKYRRAYPLNGLRMAFLPHRI